MSSQPENESGQQPSVFEIRLAWGSRDELQTIYVNQLLITVTQSECYLTFGELIPPAVGVEDVPDVLEINPKIRLAVSPPAMIAIARAIQDGVQQLTSRGTQSDVNDRTK